MPYMLSSCKSMAANLNICCDRFHFLTSEGSMVFKKSKYASFENDIKIWEDSFHTMHFSL